MMMTNNIDVDDQWLIILMMTTKNIDDDDYEYW